MDPQLKRAHHLKKSAKTRKRTPKYPTVTWTEKHLNDEKLHDQMTYGMEAFSRRMEDDSMDASRMAGDRRVLPTPSVPSVKAKTLNHSRDTVQTETVKQFARDLRDNISKITFNKKLAYMTVLKFNLPHEKPSPEAYTYYYKGIVDPEIGGISIVSLVRGYANRTFNGRKLRILYSDNLLSQLHELLPKVRFREIRNRNNDYNEIVIETNSKKFGKMDDAGELRVLMGINESHIPTHRSVVFDLSDIK